MARATVLVAVDDDEIG
jgi:hypothetical protein